MRTVYDCVDAFTPLLNTKYELILGRKGRSVQLNIQFEKAHCYHLMGLQYLKDLPELRKDRAKIFDALLDRKISNAKLESSAFYGQIQKRIHYLPLLEAMLDDNSTVFKYNEKLNAFSSIHADFLIKEQLEQRNLYLFLAEDAGEYYCRSFFPEESIDYTRGQSTWTLLYKKKINLKTGNEIILYNRVTVKKL